MQSSGVSGLFVAFLEEKRPSTFLYFDKSENGLEKALTLIHHIGQFLEFRDNWNKTTKFSIDHPGGEHIYPSCHLKIFERFHYMGIEIQVPLKSYMVICLLYLQFVGGYSAEFIR